MNLSNATGLLPDDSPSSKRSVWLRVSLVLVAAIAIVVTGVLMTNREAAQQASAAPSPAAHVAFTSVGLDTPDLQIRKDQSVMWEVQDGLEHQLMLSSDDTNAPGFGAKMQFGEGQNYSYVFNATGTYYYYDSLHPAQFSGKITVTE